MLLSSCKNICKALSDTHRRVHHLYSATPLCLRDPTLGWQLGGGQCPELCVIRADVIVDARFSLRSQKVIYKPKQKMSLGYLSIIENKHFWGGKNLSINDSKWNCSHQIVWKVWEENLPRLHTRPPSLWVPEATCSPEQDWRDVKSKEDPRQTSSFQRKTKPAHWREPEGLGAHSPGWIFLGD